MKMLMGIALVFLIADSACAQSVPVKYLSMVSTNANLVKSGLTIVRDIVLLNTTTTVYYLKLYDKATAPACGTDIPKWTIPVPFGASNSAGGVAIGSNGLRFSDGFGFCLTGAIADNDMSNAATGVALNFSIN